MLRLFRRRTPQPDVPDTERDQWISSLHHWLEVQAQLASEAQQQDQQPAPGSGTITIRRLQPGEANPAAAPAAPRQTSSRGAKISIASVQNEHCRFCGSKTITTGRHGQKNCSTCGKEYTI